LFLEFNIFRGALGWRGRGNYGLKLAQMCDGKNLKTKMPSPPVKFVNAIIIHLQKLNEIGKHFQS
jgi:hypothetical protein